MTHLCVSKITIIGSDNGLSPGRKAIIWTNAGTLLISNLRSKVKWNLKKKKSYIFIQENAFENVVREMAANLYRPQCINHLYLEA